MLPFTPVVAMALLVNLASAMPAAPVNAAVSPKANNGGCYRGHHHVDHSKTKIVPAPAKPTTVAAPPSNEMAAVPVTPEPEVDPKPAPPPKNSPAPPPADQSPPVKAVPAAPVAAVEAGSAVKPKPATPPPAPVPVGGTGGGKDIHVGIGINGESGAKAASFGPKLSWCYSWTTQTWPGMEGLEFVPMVKDEPAVDAFKAGSLGNAKYVLSLNEPNLAEQQGGRIMPEATAAALHKKLTDQVPSGVKVGSIVVSNGGKPYFDKWKAACGSACRYDFIPLHYYGMTSAGFISYVKEYANEGKPLWITEVACRQYNANGQVQICSADQSRNFMTESIKWMRGEGASLVVRWAWFGAWAGFDTPLINADGTANELGKLYGSL